VDEILFLCHRIPYPPNKGDKIRAYHWLKALSARYTVHLGTFVDDPEDWQGTEALASFCGEQCYRPLDPRMGKLRSLDGLRRGEALSFGYYRDRHLAAWVREITARRPIKAIVAFSSTMGPYAIESPGVRRVLDLVDVDSDKWSQYARSASWPMRWVYAREARTLARGEQALAQSFDATVLVSDAEADFFRARAPEAAERIHAIGNGVDAEYFDPTHPLPDPFEGLSGEQFDGPGSDQIVFTGAMDYPANVDAVCWFADEVLPLIRKDRPGAVFTIVGIRPTARVLALAEREHVCVTGAVPDVRPYLAAASVAVAPMRIARGIQNKVLEALAMSCSVVMSDQAAAGLLETDPQYAQVAVEAGEFAAAVLVFMAREESESQSARDQARAYVLRHYGWQARFDELLALIASPADASAPGTVPA